MKEWVPATLKNKLILAFTLLILIPFSILNIVNFNRVEQIMQKTISNQIHGQLNSMNRTLEDLMGVAFKTLILIEQNNLLETILKHPNDFELLERHLLVQNGFASIKNSFFLSDPQVYYTMLDFHGNVYASFPPEKSLDYKEMTESGWYKDLFDQTAGYKWIVDSNNYVHPDISRSPYLLTLYAILKDDWGKPYGVARISIDFAQWFESITRHFPIQQDYFIMNHKKEIVAQSDPEMRHNPHTLESIIAQHKNEGYFADEQTATIMSYSYIDGLQWYMVSSIPLEVLYNEIQELKSQYFLYAVLIVIAFVLITFTILTAFIRPLKELQHKMAGVVRNRLNIYLPEHRYRGEILALAQNFNQMISDLHSLVEQLKMEERQKEAIHFKMLLSQMNPHFLNNTLNTIKWIALREQNHDITQICISLGKLLETSLTSEVELIHLRKEIDLVQSYVYIQKFRYQSSFEVHYKYNRKRLQYALIPKLCLQILVENAIYHGISHLNNSGEINISITEKNNRLVVEVSDNGIGIEKAKKSRLSQSRTGVGLINLKERLHLLFKKEAGFQIISLPQGTMVRFSMPLLLSNPYDKGGV